MLIPLGNIYLLADNSEAVLNLQVTAAETNPDGELALGDNPLLADRGKADVKLRNSGTGNITSVGNRNSDVVETLPESGVTTGLDGELLRVGSDVVLKRGRLNVGDLKGGVGETETELVADRDVVGIEVTVVNLELLVEPALPVSVSSGVDSSGGRGVPVRAVVGNSVRKVTRRVDVSVENVDERVSRLLAREVGSEDSGNVGVVRPWEGVDTSRVSNDDSVVAERSNRLDNLITIPVV